MGLKYFCNYKTLKTNELWKVEIHIPSYSGTPIEKLGAGGQTCIVEQDLGDKLFDKFVATSNATITLLFDDKAQTKELQSLPDKTAITRVYRNEGTELYWQGYLISDGIQHPDNGVMTPITIKAIDMIEASEDIPFSNISCEPIAVNGVVGASNSPLNWIRKCLINPDNIDNRLPIRWSCSLKNNQYPDDDFFAGRTGFIPNYEVFASSRQKTTVLWILQNIIKSAECIMMQRDGYWYIISLVDLAKSGTLDFYQINGNDLGEKTAATVTVDLSKVLPTKINESTFTMVQKPVSKVKATYNHSMPANIIPNGGFDITDTVSGRPLYWNGNESDMVVTSVPPINARGSGRALRGKNNSLIANRSVTYSANDISTLPFDADVLFKDMQWGFTFMPIGFPTNSEGIIDWSSNPLNARVLYTAYDEQGNITQYNLNEFGFWQSSAPADGFKIVSVNTDNPFAVSVTFSGNSYNGQRYYRTIGSDIWDITFDGQRTLAQTLNYIALNDPRNPTIAGNSLVYARVSFSPASFYVSEVNPFTASLISFSVDNLKNEEVATVQFQSKGNQGRVLMPFPGKLDIENKPVLAGKLSLEFIFQQGQEYILDDVYMNVSDNKEFWETSDDGNDGLAEYELDISSSFSGFMTSSYMNGFSTADLSMFMNNGTDTGTLTELFGKTALRFLSKPTEKVDTEVEGELGINSLISYRGTKFLPLKSSINTETNSTKLTIAELVFDEDLAIESVHKSTGDGDSSGFSQGGYGGGGNNNGDNLFLTDLKDVAITTPQQGDLLAYNVATGKWENSDDYRTFTQLQSIFHPLENQRLSTGNNVTFNGVRGTDYVAIPSAASSISGVGYTIWVDENGTGGSATPPPIVVNLTDLQDVSISSPTNGQALVYDVASGKWSNASVVTDLSNYYTKSESDARFKAIGWFPAWNEVTGKPTNFVFNDGGTYGINISGSAAKLGGLTANFSQTFDGYVNTLLGTDETGTIKVFSITGVKDRIGLDNGSNLNNNISGSAARWGGRTADLTNLGTSLAYIYGSDLNNGLNGRAWDASQVRGFIGLPTSGAYDLQWITGNGSTTDRNITISNTSNPRLGIKNGNNQWNAYVDSLGSYILSQQGVSDRLFINPNGNVGINNSLPQSALDVNGAIITNDVYQLRKSTTGNQYERLSIYKIGTGFVLEAYNDFTGQRPNIIFQPDGGNIGIGKTPTEALDVNGNVLAQGVKATTKLETRGVNSSGTPSGAYYDCYVQE